MYKPEPMVKMFYDGIEEGKFLGKKCPECGNVEFPPMHGCNKCGHHPLDWFEVSGEVVVEEIFELGSAFTLTEFTPFAPLYGMEGHMAEGSELPSLIFGVSKDTFEELKESVPLKGNLCVLPMEKYNSFAVSINGVLPVRAGEKKQTRENAMWSAMKLSEITEEDQ